MLSQKLRRSAAALACGFTALELGSDIGGPVRISAHFCGAYGHMSTHGIISLQGISQAPRDIWQSRIWRWPDRWAEMQKTSL
ncbi:amidase family protein [Pseudomonas yamanorum]|uniref:amidase family protein n=1 Tax=Pseudomonas yamanorum TaxID=515393 RepID=UPI001C430059